METVPENEVVDHEASKVHFSNDVQMNTEINVVKKSNENVDIHLGFLMEAHTYEVEFVIPTVGQKNWTSPQLENPDIQIQKIQTIGEDLQIAMEVKCRFEGKLKRVLTIQNVDDKEKALKIHIFARIMGKHKGTAMLKNGIKCIHIQDDTLSDNSDWQGFE
eukprot:gene5330-5999_t